MQSGIIKSVTVKTATMKIGIKTGMKTGIMMAMNYALRNRKTIIRTPDQGSGPLIRAQAS